MEYCSDRSEKRAAVKRKRTKSVFAAAAVIALSALGIWVYSARDEVMADKLLTFETNSERVKFLNRQGWIVHPEPEYTDVIIPEEFNEDYEEYNALQQSQGLDLEKYKGKEAVLCSYKLLNYPDYAENMTANMLLDDHRLIGADITYNDAENGFTAALIQSDITAPDEESTEN